MQIRAMALRTAGVFWLAAQLEVAALAQASPAVVLQVTDTARVSADDDPVAARVLAGLEWEAQQFEVRVEEVTGRDYDARVTFASPRPSGDAGIDTVVLRWYRPPPEAPREVDAAAGLLPGEGLLPGRAGVLLVHTLHPDLPIATMLARGLKQRGVHGFVIELPGYASRRGASPKMTGVTTLVHGAQAVTDCRRAFDVIRVLGDLETLREAGLPVEAGVTAIDPQRIAIQGTSLGSFVATSAAAFDGCFSQTFLFLSGGDGVSILENGQKDAYHVRGALKHYGYTGEKLKALLDTIEPLHIAHRLDPAATWMFNARGDLVVPAHNATLLAEAIGLDESHHLWLTGNHYTAFFLLPGVLDKIQRELANAASVEAETTAEAESETTQPQTVSPAAPATP